MPDKLPRKDEEPTPVLIAEEQHPIPVTVEASAPAPQPHTVQAGQGTVLAPTTTEQEDIVTAGQRRISVLWESSQSVISLAITGAVIYCQIKGITSETLNNAFFFVVATYLQRTNHVRIGGIGPKPYQGR